MLHSRQDLRSAACLDLDPPVSSVARGLRGKRDRSPGVTDRVYAQTPNGLHSEAGDPRPRHSSESEIRGLDRVVSVDRAGLLRCRHDRVGRGAAVKAVVYDRYGSPDVLQVEDVPIPRPPPARCG